MRILFLFLDGVGLGSDDLQSNPFVQAKLPYLTKLLGGRRLTASALNDSGELVTPDATLLALDAGLGIAGLPQSATGQATLLTGINIPQAIGEHYGPKPNPAIAAHLRNGNLFSQLVRSGKQTSLLNAYPPGYFAGIASGKRLYSAIPLAITSAGIALLTEADLRAGEALAADFTGAGWQQHLKIDGIPSFTPYQAGVKLAQLAQKFDLAFFEYWLSDTAGHRQDMEAAIRILETLDGVLGGLLESWDHKDGRTQDGRTQEGRTQEGLILITSDHGNLEDLSTRRHTHNPVPALLIGDASLRQRFAAGLQDLTDITPAILEFLG